MTAILAHLLALFLSANTGAGMTPGADVPFARVIPHELSSSSRPTREAPPIYCQSGSRLRVRRSVRITPRQAGSSSETRHTASSWCPRVDLFFVSVGMLFDPRYLLEAPGLVFATVSIVLLGKPLAALAIVLALGYPARVAFSVAIALAQIGEFSFILAGLGKSLGILPDAATNTLVAAAIVSISLNPFLYRLVDPLEAWASHRPSLRRWVVGRGTSPKKHPTVSSPDQASEIATGHRAVIVGYGPVGRTLTRLLQENEVEPTIIEMNLETVNRLREEGLMAVYGDASHRETLKLPAWSRLFLLS